MKPLIPYDAIETVLIEKGIYKPNKGKPGRPSIPANLMEMIFNQVKAQMSAKNLILNEGTLVDATLIHASEPKRKRDENGKVISNEAADADATYTSKRGAKHHGYKMHIATDRAGVIKDIRTTTAKVHDSQMIDALIEDETKAVFADSGYMSQDRKRSLRAKGIFGGIIERRVRGQSELRTKQSRNNQRFSKIRAIVEMPFAFIKRLMHYTESKYIGLHKNTQHHYLLAAAYNLRRMPNLMQRGA
jgi:transposase, IS5 family